METFVTFVGEYWITFLCTALGGFITALAQKLYRRYKSGKDSEQNKPFEDFKSEIGALVKSNLEVMTNRQNNFEERIENYVFDKVEEKENEFDKEEKSLLDKMDELNTTFQNLCTQFDESCEQANLRQQGLLYLYKKTFIADCENLLEVEYITHDEYEDIINAYQQYHKLGGNHQGDIMFKAVGEKYSDQQKNKRGTN